MALPRLQYPVTRTVHIASRWLQCNCIVSLSLICCFLLNIAIASSATDQPCSITSYYRNKNDIHFDPVTRSYSIDVNIDQRVQSEEFKCGEEPSDNENLSFLKLLTETFTQASIAMHEATRYNAHIGEVRFLLPDTWRTENFRENQDLLECHSSNPEMSSIRIVENPTECSAKVRGTDCCGLPASGKMTLDSGVFFPCNRGTCDDPAKKIVHEFAHLHWGIGDEYKRSDASVPKCAEGRENSKDGRGVSIMASLKDHAQFFCDNLARGEDASSSVLHNSNADTNHNELCQGRSAWEVLRQHQNFSNSHTRKPNATLVPVFRYAIKCTGELNVFVIDVTKNASIKTPVKKFLGRTSRHVVESFSKSTSNYANAAIITYDSSGKTDTIAQSPKIVVANLQGKMQLLNSMHQLRHGVNSVNAASLDAALKLASRLMNHVTRVDKAMYESSTSQAIVISQNPQLPKSTQCLKNMQVLFFGSPQPIEHSYACKHSGISQSCHKIHRLAHFASYSYQCTKTVFGASTYVRHPQETRTITGNIKLNAMAGSPAVAGRMDYYITVNIVAPDDAEYGGFTSRFQFQYFDPNEAGRKINMTMNGLSNFQTWRKQYEASSTVRMIGFTLNITASTPGRYSLLINATPKSAAPSTLPLVQGDSWFKTLTGYSVTHTPCDCLSRSLY
ncbi:uncharacterized protein LOC135810891 [Sycon ciliatum]|uniref:uncharacterized protein LOC135810891 n=1 Tax=Sycon ciliatum TaxID=27933 RepID=UPI0031F71FF6